jgi:hypothetical protein
LVQPYRIEVQDRVRRSGSKPNENDKADMDRMRQVLISQFSILDEHNPIPSAVFLSGKNKNSREETIFDNLDQRDDLAVDVDGTVPVPIISNILPEEAASNITQPERRHVSIPSNWIANNNEYRKIELDLRISQGTRILSGLRDLIAEKSFHFSDVIRVAPRKGVRTRARSTVAKINNQITYHCRVYNLCRAALVRLRADQTTLTKFSVLERQDVRSSTRLLKPNQPGSTTDRLSWIWQCGKNADDETSMGLYECK